MPQSTVEGHADQGPVTIRLIDAGMLARALPFPVLVEGLQRAFAAADISVPPRAHHGLEGLAAGAPVLLSMPAWGPGWGVGSKLVTVYPRNASQGLPSVHGLYVLMDAATGRPEAVFDAGELTARRTAAASALASRFLSRPDSATLLMVGSGRLAGVLPLAHAAVRSLRQVLVWGRSLDKAEATAVALRAQGLPAEACARLEEGCAVADIVSCATLSDAPLVRGAWLRPDAHVDLVGAFTPAMRETDDAVFARAEAVWCDTRAGVLAEGGDVLHALAAGALGLERIAGDLTDLCRAGAATGRRGSGITVFKSVGYALEDLAAARLCLDRMATAGGR